MLFLTKPLNFLTSSNLYIAFAASALYIYYAVLLNRNFFLLTPIFIFFATYFSYNLLRFFPRNKGLLRQGRVRYILKKNPFLIITNLFALLLLSYFVFELKEFEVISLALAFGLTLFYENVFTQYFSFRKIAFIKPFVIALCWCLICVIIHRPALDINSLSAFFHCFFFLFILCLAMDFRDRDRDKKSKIRSLTHLYSLKKTKATLVIVFIIFQIINIYFFQTPLPLALLQVGCFILAITFYTISTFQRDTYADLLIDGCIILQSASIFYLS